MASKRVVKAIIVLAVFGAFIVATYETFFWFTHVYENDARVETDLSQISSQVNGKIEKILTNFDRKIHFQSVESYIQTNIYIHLKTEGASETLSSIQYSGAIEPWAIEPDLTFS